MRISEEEEFLDLLYGAAAQPELWTRAFERFSDLIGGTSVLMSRLSVVDGLGAGLMARIDPEMTTAYLEHFADQNVLNNVKDPQAYVTNWRLDILTDEDWMAKEDFVATEYYTDFLAPYGVHSTLMIRLAMRDQEVCALTINRPRNREQFGGQDLELACRLHGHLIRAYHLSERLVGLNETNNEALPAIEQLGQALLVLNCEGRVRQMNQAADRLIASGVGLDIRNGRLVLSRPELNLRLQALVAAAGSANLLRRTGGSITLSGAVKSASPVLTVAPVPAGTTELFGEGPAIIVTLTNPPSAPPLLSEAGLRGAFGLTTAEARVSLALCDGISPREAADRLGVSIHTVRHQLQNVFEKTGAKRQTELLRLLLGGSGPSAK